MQLALHDPHQSLLFDANQMDIPFPLPKTIADYMKIVLADGRTPRPFQAENVWFFAEKAKFRGICEDDTGLGKTITACCIVHEFKQDLVPLLFTCRTTLKAQMWVEILSTLGIIADIIKSSADLDLINPDAQAWIISYDMIKRIEDLEERISPKLIILDEVQLIKNPDSARTQAIMEFAAKIPNIIALSATPIKNNLLEYYPILHLVRPDRFPNKKMLEQMCNMVETSNGKYKYGGLNPFYEDAWRALTADIIIRHKREEVAKDLPTILRNHRYVKIEDQKAIKAIAAEMEKFIDAYDQSHNYDAETSTMSYQEARRAAGASLMRLRHLVGDAKIPYIVDYIEEFLTENPDRKLTVFVHHKTVAEGVIAGVAKLRFNGVLDINEPFIIRGGMNEEVRNRLVMQCTRNSGWPTNDPKDRLLIASALAAGEGINLQKCHDALMAERQFNPPNEEQPEGRFSRLGAEGVKNIFIVYLTLLNTLDEWFHKLVEQKRIELKRTHGDKDFYGGLWQSEDEIVTDLMDLVAEQGRKFLKSVNKSVKKVKKGEVV